MVWGVGGGRGSHGWLRRGPARRVTECPLYLRWRLFFACCVVFSLHWGISVSLDSCFLGTGVSTFGLPAGALLPSLPGFHGRGTQRDQSPLLCPLSSCTGPHHRPSRLSASGPLAWSTLRLTRPLHPSSPRCVLRAGPLSFNSIRAFRNTHSFDLLPAAPLYFPLLLGFIYLESV